MIEQRSPNTWRVGFQTSVQDGQRWIRRTVTFPAGLSVEEQRSRAQLEEARLRVEYSEGLYVQESPITVRDFSKIWIDDHVRENCTADTLKNYQYFLDSRILPALGDVPLQRLTPTACTRFIKSLRAEHARTTAIPADQRIRTSDRLRPPAPARTLSDRTVRHYYDTLSYMLEKAVQWEYLARNPMKKVDRPKIRKKPIRVLDDDQAVQLLRCLAAEDNLPFRCAVLLALLCGLRLGEVGALRLLDVNWTDCSIDISRALHYTPATGSFYGDPKSEASTRTVDLPPGMMALLEETRLYHIEAQRLLGDRWRGDGLIVSAWDGTPLNKDTPSKQWRKFADKHGFEGVRFHDLRHSHATILFANNLDAVAVATRLGHASADTTLRIYAHAVRRRDRESAAAMQALLDRAQQPPAPAAQAQRLPLSAAFSQRPGQDPAQPLPSPGVQTSIPPSPDAINQLVQQLALQMAQQLAAQLTAQPSSPSPSDPSAPPSPSAPSTH